MLMDSSRTSSPTHEVYWSQRSQANSDVLETVDVSDLLDRLTLLAQRQFQETVDFWLNLKARVDDDGGEKWRGTVWPKSRKDGTLFGDTRS